MHEELLRNKLDKFREISRSDFVFAGEEHT